MTDKPCTLADGSRIGIVGAGPAGSFFAIFALKMAQMMGLDLQITLFENKDFTKVGPGGCNHCGGVISELLVQTLALEGINLPGSIIQRGICAYELHTAVGSVGIESPTHEKRIATISRGSAPLGMVAARGSFDQFLVEQAVAAGAKFSRQRITRLSRETDSVSLYAGTEKVLDADLLVGAFGLNRKSGEMFAELGFDYQPTDLLPAAIAEIDLHGGDLSERLGTAIQLFLVPDPDIRFAALIPKATHATLVMLGKRMEKDTAAQFLQHPVVRRALPEIADREVRCLCLPKLSCGAAARNGFADRVVVCGDAGSTRIFKDGIGSAYVMSKAAARTAVFEGVSAANFREHYYPAYRETEVDNMYGAFMFGSFDIYRRSNFMIKRLVQIVEREQARPADAPKPCSAILWDMFTGNEKYRNVFMRGLKPQLHGSVLKAMVGK